MDKVLRQMGVQPSWNCTGCGDELGWETTNLLFNTAGQANSWLLFRLEEVFFQSKKQKLTIVTMLELTFYSVLLIATSAWSGPGLSFSYFQAGTACCTQIYNILGSV